VPIMRLMEGSDLARASREDAFTITTPDGRNPLTVRDTVIVRATSAREAPRAWERVLPAGNYAYRVESRVASNGRGARARANLVLTPFPAGALAASDLLVARRLEPRPGALPRALSDFVVVPQATLSFRQDDTVGVYWETYGVRPDSGGAGRLRIELSLTLREIDRGTNLVVRAFGGVLDATGLTARGDTRTAVRFDRAVPAAAVDRAPNYFSLDLRGAPSGTYTLLVRTTDLTTGRTVDRERTIRVRLP
jgi:hypothetical protein